MLDLAKDTLNSAVEPENLTPVYLRDKVTWKKVSEQGKKA
jgi:tRNA A37 threonylcarbamoyladenosine modification protein TsaB